MKTFMDFVRAVYKAATPSVDFDSAERIDCCAHKLDMDTYEQLLAEFAGEDRDRRLACNMFMLDKGPQLV